MQALARWISFLADSFTVLASAVALYIFFAKRKAVSAVLKMLLNYSFQSTLSELRRKLDRMSELTVDDAEQSAEAVNILSDVVGQIRGNKVLRLACDGILPKAEKYCEVPRTFNERRKRALVSELRETLRHATIQTFDEAWGGEQ